MRNFKIYSPNDFQICNIVLLTLVTMLYITSPWLIYFITGSLYLLTPFTHFIHHPCPPTSGNHESVLCIYEPDVLLLFLDFMYKWDHMVFYLSFSVWPMSLSIMPSRFIYTPTNGKISFSLWLNHVPLCVCVMCMCITSSLSIHLSVDT